jgi:hypothetical protein
MNNQKKIKSHEMSNQKKKSNQNHEMNNPKNHQIKSHETKKIISFVR